MILCRFVREFQRQAGRIAQRYFMNFNDLSLAGAVVWRTVDTLSGRTTEPFLEPFEAVMAGPQLVQPCCRPGPVIWP